MYRNRKKGLFSWTHTELHLLNDWNLTWENLCFLSVCYVVCLSNREEITKRARSVLCSHTSGHFPLSALIQAFPLFLPIQASPFVLTKDEDSDRKQHKTVKVSIYLGKRNEPTIRFNEGTMSRTHQVTIDQMKSLPWKSWFMRSVWKLDHWKCPSKSCYVPIQKLLCAHPKVMMCPSKSCHVTTRLWAPKWYKRRSSWAGSLSLILTPLEDTSPEEEECFQDCHQQSCKGRRGELWTQKWTIELHQIQNIWLVAIVFFDSEPWLFDHE